MPLFPGSWSVKNKLTQKIYMKIQTYFSMRGRKWQKLEGPQRKAFLMYLAPGSFALSQAGCHNLFDCHMKCPDLDAGRWRVVNTSLMAQVASVNHFFGTHRTIVFTTSPHAEILHAHHVGHRSDNAINQMSQKKRWQLSNTFYDRNSSHR